MSLWTQFGEENPAKTREHVLAMIEFQDAQLARITDPITADIENRVSVQEDTLAQIYKPITADLKRQVKKQAKNLRSIQEQIKTDEVLEQFDSRRLPPAKRQEIVADDSSDIVPLDDVLNDVPIVVTESPKLPPRPVEIIDVSETTGETDTVERRDFWCTYCMQFYKHVELTGVDIETVVKGIKACGGIITSQGVTPDVGPTLCFRMTYGNWEKCRNVISIAGTTVKIISCDPDDFDGGDDEDDEDKDEEEDKRECDEPPACPAPVCCPQGGNVKGEEIALEDPPEAGKLWEPDTERICDLMTDYINRFTAVGESVLGNLSSTATAASTVSRDEGGEQVTNTVLSAILPIVGAINPARFVGVIADVVRGLSTSITSGMIVQGAAYVGLQVIRIVLDSLESTTIGWNLGPAVLLNIRISLQKEKQVLNYLQNFLWPVEIPATPDVSTLLVTGEISQVHAECLWRMNNSLPRLEHKLNYARRPQVTPTALTSLMFRNDGTVFELFDRLKKQGWQDIKDVGELVSSSLFVPPPSDAISMAVKDVFDPNLFARDLMEREYRNQRGLDALFRANGIGEVNIKGIDPANGDNVDVGLLYWYAHYQHCSPTQVYEMLHRLRPNRVAKWTLPGQTPEQVRGMVTGIDEVRNLLKLNDYNPFWRDRLAAIAYRVIGRIDVRRFYGSRVFGKPLGRRGFRVTPNGFILTGQAEKELGESYQDMGYSPDDAIKLAVYTATEFDNKRLAPQKNVVKGQVCEAMAVGYANEETLTQLLIDSGFEPDEADSIILACRLKYNVAKLKRAITLVKRSVLGNRLQVDGARVILGQLGVIPERINDYISVWELDVRMRAKEPEAEKLCSWFGAGFLTLDEFMTRLSRLGYTQIDVKRIVAHCYVGIEAKRGKEQAKMAKMLEKGKKEAERKERDKLRKFLSARTDANLIAWYKAGEITLSDIIWTLQNRGWSADDIKRWIHAKLGVENGKETVNEA